MELISKDEVFAIMDKINESHTKLEGTPIEEWATMCIEINSLPTVEERKEGRWVPVDSYSAFGGDEETWEAHGNPIAYHYCSECDEDAQINEFGDEILSKFCPNCGAKMKGE